MKTDRELQHEVLAEMRHDPRIETQQLSVQVEAATVTLRGTVTSCTGRLAAQQAAQRVPGVAQVDNRLHVVIPDQHLRTDKAIKQAAEEHLAWDAEVPHSGIQVAVAGGVVTLEGQVDYEYHRDVAERVLQHLTGVRGVINKLAVSTPLVENGALPSADLSQWHPIRTPQPPISTSTPQ
jgi:osmotically-inducible protein OsmY